MAVSSSRSREKIFLCKYPRVVYADVAKYGTSYYSTRATEELGQIKWSYSEVFAFSSVPYQSRRQSLSNEAKKPDEIICQIRCVRMFQ